MGWERSFAHQISAEQRPMVALRPVDATPVLLLTSLPNYAPISGMHKLLLSRSSIGLTRNAAYDAGQWPILPLPALPFIPELPADDAAPISQAALTALLDATSVAKTSDEEITAVLSPIFAMVPPLSGAARAEMYRFIRIAAALMEGGLPSRWTSRFCCGLCRWSTARAGILRISRRCWMNIRCRRRSCKIKVTPHK